MRKCRKAVCIFLCLVLLSLSACGPQPAPSTTTVPQAATTVSTAPVWPGYVDAKTDYEYYYAEGRDRQWEEDILYFANSLLTEHPMLRNRAFLIDLPNYETDSANFYDEALLREVVSRINLLISEVASLQDGQIYHRLRWILSLFDDVHTRLEYYGNDYFPIIFMPFYEDGEPVFYAVALPQKHEEALFARLDAINGYPLAEVIEKIRPYVPVETEYGFMEWLDKGGVGAGFLRDADTLEAAGVLELGARQAVYTLTAEDGTVHEVKLGVKSSDVTWAGQWYVQVHPVLFADYGVENYWFTEELAEDTLYVRISSFQVETAQSYLQFSGELSQAYRAHGSYGKIIVDLRCNGGGSEGTGFDVLLKVLADMQCDRFYILIDGGTYSMSTIFAGELVARRDGDAILAGMPAGEAAGFFAGIWSEDYIMPNCQVEFTIPTGYYQPFPAGEDNIIMPELLIWPTLEDYIAGRDTVLFEILGIE